MWCVTRVLEEAMDMLDMASQQMAIFKILAAVLHLGNVEFEIIEAVSSSSRAVIVAAAAVAAAAAEAAIARIAALVAKLATAISVGGSSCCYLA